MTQTVKYSILKRTNEEYDLDKIERQDLLYRGGFDIMANASRFIPKLAAESEQAYQDRLQASSYIPYLSQFIDYFTSFLFSKELRVTDAQDKSPMGYRQSSATFAEKDFYKEFAADCDMEGNTLHSFMHCVFQDALIHGKSYVGIDLPQIDVIPANLLEEELLGKNRAYLYRISNASVVDWKDDEEYEGKFEWVKLRNDLCQQEGPLSDPVRKVQFIVWTMDNGFAKVSIYESDPLQGEELQDEQELTLVNEVTTSFTEIPIFCLCLEDGLAIGEKIGPICIEYYQRRSLAVVSQNKSCIAIPVVYLGPDTPAVNGAINDNQSDPARGDFVKMSYLNKGYSVLGSEDEFKIVETEGKAHASMNESLAGLSQLMHEIVHQMANSVKGSMNQARSAQAMQEQRFATEIVLSAYHKSITGFVKELYNCLQQTQGDDAAWSVSGLSTNAAPDKTELLEEAKILPTLSIPSSTFKKKYASRLALALLEGAVSPEEAETIVDEISQAVDQGGMSESVSPAPVAKTGNAKPAMPMDSSKMAMAKA